MFLLFYGLICDFLEFSPEISSTIFTAHRITRDTNLKHEIKIVRAGSHHLFAKLSLLPLRKTGLIDFPEKRAPIKILLKETRENSLSVLLFALMLRS